MDQTSFLSESFSLLSVGNTDPPHEVVYRDTIPTLTRVSRERDLFTDGDHSPLDAELMKAFSAFRRHNEEPDLSTLLSHITLSDKRLVTLPPGDAEELLKRQPSINAILQRAWKDASFKEVRQLGAFFVLRKVFFFEPLVIIEEILWPVVREARRWFFAFHYWDW
jgi:hypothetical protein